MENPSLRGSSFIANSLFAGLQIILPGEIAPSHRHTPNALRFVVDGEGAYTSISGEKIDIHPGDFIVTPSWSWHDHGNLGADPVVWMDGLDTPFTSLFGAHFRENYPDDVYPLSKNANDSVLKFGSGMLPLEYGVDSSGFENLLIYPFIKTRQLLFNLAKSPSVAIDPCQGYKMRYTNPSNGQYPFRTMAAFMQLLPAGFMGRSYQTTENTVFNVASGECLITLTDKQVELKTHDVMVIPSWEKYHFEANQDCLLFSFSDRSAQQLLGFWKESKDEFN
jgi:gentisate 1,2-dioxygenase